MIKYMNKVPVFCFPVLLMILSSFSENFLTNSNLNKLSIDHVNVAVNDLSKAKLPYERLGFTIKPGRFHNNSIDNLHIKFVNGTELELITAKKPLDDLAVEYLNLINKGDGGAFLALQAKSFITTITQEFQKKYPIRIEKGVGFQNLVFDENHPLRPIWFIEMGTPFKDIPEFTTHKNSAQKLVGVWISNQIADEVMELFTLLKRPIKTTDLPIKDSQRICLDGGEICLVNLPINTIGRPIVGVTIEVAKINITKEILKSEEIFYSEIFNDSTKSIIISPDFTQNIYIEFREYKRNL